MDTQSSSFALNMSPLNLAFLDYFRFKVNNNNGIGGVSRTSLEMIASKSTDRATKIMYQDAGNRKDQSPKAALILTALPSSLQTHEIHGCRGPTWASTVTTEVVQASNICSEDQFKNGSQLIRHAAEHVCSQTTLWDGPMVCTLSKQEFSSAVWRNLEISFHQVGPILISPKTRYFCQNGHR